MLAEEYADNQFEKLGLEITPLQSMRANEIHALIEEAFNAGYGMTTMIEVQAENLAIKGAE